MKEYREFTFGWVIFAVTGPAHLLIVLLFVNASEDRPMPLGAFMLVNVIILTIYILFYGLTTRVTDREILLSFGIGLIRKRISLERIQQAERVETPWYYGWGIRFIPDGMLYNIHGTEGIEISFSDTRRVIRIGSKNPALLREEIVKRLSAAYPHPQAVG